MKIREIAIDLLATAPLSWVLTALGRSRLAAGALNQASHPRGVFRSFDEAWRVAKRFGYAGHDHPDYFRNQIRFTTGLRASDYAVLYWLSQLARESLKVLDFGGNIGNIYYSYSDYLRRCAADTEWVVFDLPAAIDHGRRLAAERGERKLRFTYSLADLDGEYIILVSSAFHYWEKSVGEFIAQFAGPPQHILVNRIPVQERESSFFTVQHRKTYAHPCRVWNSTELIANFADAGYDLVDRWSAPELRIRMPLFPTYTVEAYSGFYFRRRSLANTAAISPDRGVA
jgi:putative methyltransferase (TIGR04325 family)